MNIPQSVGKLEAFARKMAAAGLGRQVIDTFADYYRQVVSGETGLIYDRDIRPVDAAEIPATQDLARYAAQGDAALNQTVMITLNGGLGTSMGLIGPKSLLKVKDGKTFLDIILARAERSGSRLALMNSFKTQGQTEAALNTARASRAPVCFLQNRFPKILQADLSPASWPPNPELEWNPPGHGDVYTALQTSGLLDRLLAESVTYAFISNSDNLGASLDNRLLGYFAARQHPFMMEVCRKTPADVKGGHLARRRNGRLLLREAAQCPDNERKAFEDIRRYSFFNTNNIWLNLSFLKRLLAREGTIRLPIIVNPKTLDPRDDESPSVYQVETAMGAAISLFEGATAVEVPRDRFFPVKKCNDLLSVRSDLFVLTPDQRLALSPERPPALGDTVNIDLDPRFYGKIDLFEKRFPHGPPSLLGCRSLAIRGDVTFEADVKLEGDARLTQSGSQPAVVSRGSVLRGDIAL